MVRETRHLWVGNLPDNASEDRIKEHFKRYGPVQSVKLGASGEATVAFVDICSATKAQKVDHRLDDHVLKTVYHEPQISVLPNSHYPSSGSNSIHRNDSHYTSTATSNSGIHGGRSPRFNLPDEHNSYDRSSHFYENRREETITYNGHGASSTANVNAGLRRGYGGDRDPEYNAQSRGRVRSYPSRAPFQTNGRPESGDFRWGGGQYRYHSESYSNDKMRRTTTPGPSPPPTSRSIPRNSRATGLPAKRHPPASRSGSESPSSSRSSRSSSTSSSNSSSSHSSSSETSVARSSRSNTRSPRHFNGPTGQSSVLSPRSPLGEKRPLALRIRNLPPWSLDNSLKDGLFHDYKKHGTVTTVRIFGTAADRYAIVCFKRADDVEKALVASRGKQFFGVAIEVVPHEGLELDESEYRSNELEMDEYHHKATRTLFVGGLDQEITSSELRKKFEPFGEVLDIDIKNQSVATYAFVQYSDIRSVVQAGRKMEGEYIGSNRIKLGFGKSMQNRCLWVGGLPDNCTESMVVEAFMGCGTITSRQIDRERGQALLSFENERQAGNAINEMRGGSVNGRRIQVDFASRECQVAFYSKLEKTEYPTADRSWERRDVDKFERQRRDGSYVNRQVSATPRISYNNASRTRRYDGYEEYPNGRNYEEYADDSFERDLHEYAGRQRFENGPSSATSSTSAPPAPTQRSYSPAKLREKSPFSPRPTPRSDSEHQSPIVRPHDDAEVKKTRLRSPDAFETESYHSPTLSSKLSSPNPKFSAKRTTHSPPTSALSSPSREVSVVEDKNISDPRRRRPSDFKSLVVKVNDTKKFGDLGPRAYNRKIHDAERERSSKSDIQDPRLCLRREEPTPSSGDERQDQDRLAKKSAALSDRANNRRATNYLDNRIRGLSPSFRKPFDSRKTSHHKNSKDKSKMFVETPREKHSSSSADPRCRKHVNTDESLWPSKVTPVIEGELSPPGTPVRDEIDEPTPSYSRNYPCPDEDILGFNLPLNLPLPRFAHSIKTLLSPRSSSPTHRAPSFSICTAPNSPIHCAAEKLAFFSDITDSALTDTPVSPGPVFQDISDNEDSLGEESFQSIELMDKIKSLDVKFQQWSGSTRGAGLNTQTITEDRIPSKSRSEAVLQAMKRIPSLEECDAMKPSAIVQAVLARASIFDEDRARLTNIDDKYIPRMYQGNNKQKTVENIPVISKPSPIPSATPLSSLPGIRTSSAPHSTSSSISGIPPKSSKPIVSVASPLGSPLPVVECDKTALKSILSEKCSESLDLGRSLDSPSSEKIYCRRSSACSNSSIFDAKKSVIEEPVLNSPRRSSVELHPQTPSLGAAAPAKFFPRSSKSEPSGYQISNKEIPLKMANAETPPSKTAMVEDPSPTTESSVSELPPKKPPQADKLCTRKRKNSSLDSDPDKGNDPLVKDEPSARIEPPPKRIKMECEEEKENRNKSPKENNHSERKDKSRSDRKREEDQSSSVQHLEIPLKQSIKEEKRHKQLKDEKTSSRLTEGREMKSLKEEKTEKDAASRCARSAVSSSKNSEVSKEPVKEEKVRKEIDRRRNSEETKQKDDKREKSRKDRDKVKDKDRHRNNSIASDDKPRDKSLKEKDRMKHKLSSKSEKSSQSIPERHYQEEDGSRSKRAHTKPSKPNHDGLESCRTHKNYIPSKVKDSVDRSRDSQTKDKHKNSVRKYHDSQRSLDKLDETSGLKNQSDGQLPSPKIKTLKTIARHENLKIATEDISSDEDCLKAPQRLSKRTKERVNSNSSGSRCNEKVSSNVGSEIESSEEEDGDEPKKPSYFDIPVYFGDMYDNVKTRAVKVASKMEERKKTDSRQLSKSIRSKKRSVLQSDSDVSDIEAHVNRQIACTSSEEETAKSQLSPTSGDHNDSVFCPGKNIKARRSSSSKESKLSKPLVSDISTDEESVLNRSIVSTSNSQFEPGFLSTRKTSSDSERSEGSVRKVPRPSTTVGQSKTSGKVSRRESRDSIEEGDGLQSPRRRTHRKSSTSVSSPSRRKDDLKPAVRQMSTPVHMASLFGVLSDDSDSNVASTNESDLESFRKESVATEVVSLEKSPCHSVVLAGDFESDDDSRPLTPDIAIHARRRSVETGGSKSFVCDKALQKEEILLTDEKDELIANMSSSWKDSNKDNLSEISRSDSGKGSSCGVSTTSSSSGSSSEELLLLEAAAASFNPECETEDYQQPSINPKAEVESLRREHASRKDKKKKKHKDKAKRSSTKSHSKSKSQPTNAEVIKIDSGTNDANESSPEMVPSETEPHLARVAEKKSMALDMPFIEADYSSESNAGSEAVSVKTSVKDTVDEAIESSTGKERDTQARASRSNISQEETQNAVAGLLACYNGYPDSPSSQNLDELPNDGPSAADEHEYQSDEAHAAVQILASEMPCGLAPGPSSDDHAWGSLSNQNTNSSEDAKEIQIVSNRLNKSSPKISPSKTDKPHVPSDHFPDSPASVQSEPALQIDETPESSSDPTDLSSSAVISVSRGALVEEKTTQLTPGIPVLLEETKEEKSSFESTPKETEIETKPKVELELVPSETCHNEENNEDDASGTQDTKNDIVPSTLKENCDYEDSVGSPSKKELDAKDETMLDSSIGSSLDDSFEGDKESTKPKAIRGRSKGRGRRGRGSRTDTTMDDGNTIVTRSSLTTRNRSRGSSGRGSRSQEPGTEEEGSYDSRLPEQPRRSTRTKRARKHPDMVDHDESTLRRKRNTRGARSNNADCGIKFTPMSSDVYDFHASDDESSRTPTKKGKKDSVPGAPIVISSTKEEEAIDSISQRKSPRLREKIIDGDSPSMPTAMAIDQIPSATRSRGRIRTREETEDDGSVARKKKILKAYEAEKKDTEAVTSQPQEPMVINVPVTSTVIQHSLTTRPTAVASNLHTATTASQATVQINANISPYTIAQATAKTTTDYVLESQSPPVTSNPQPVVTSVNIIRHPVVSAAKGLTTHVSELYSKRVPSVRAVMGVPEDKEPTPLVDPVTGHLTPMDIDDEGQYIPISGEQVLRPSALVTRSKVENVSFPGSHAKGIRAVIPPNLTVTTVSLGNTATTPSVNTSYPSESTRAQNILSISRVGEVSVELVSKPKTATSSQKGVVLSAKTPTHMPLIIAATGSVQGSQANNGAAKNNHTVQISQIKAPAISPAQISISQKVPIGLTTKPKGNLVIPIKSEHHFVSGQNSLDPVVQHPVANKNPATTHSSHPDVRSVITSTAPTIAVADKHARVYADDVRFSDPRYREPPTVEVTRVEPPARSLEPESSNGLAPRQAYEMHAGTPGRGNIRCTASPVSSQSVKPPVGHFYPGHEFVADIQAKGVPPGTPSPAHTFVPGNVATGGVIDPFLTPTPLSTPPGGASPTPPPAHHHNQRENVQPMGAMLYRVPFMVQPQRNVYDPASVPIDLKLGEKQSLDKISEDKDIRGPLAHAEFLARQSAVIAPHDRPVHQLVSPHYDRGADSPKMVAGIHQRRYPNHFDYPARAGTPNMDIDLPRSPAHQFGPGIPQSDVPMANSPYHAAENLPYLLPQELQVMWEGILGLKNDQALVKMHFISGSGEVARGALHTNLTRTIRISQRMRLEQSQLEGVARKMQMPAEHCVLMAVPYGRTHQELAQQHRSLENGFIKYLGDKKAAGIVNVSAPGSHQSAFVIHIFPPCDFVNEKMARIAPNVAQSFANTPRMMVVIATC